MIRWDSLTSTVFADARAFREAEPFPHVVIDDFCEPDELRQAVAMIPDPDDDRWHGYQRKKQGLNRVDLLPSPVQELFTELESPFFLNYLSHLTGVEDLIADPTHAGAGVHRIPRGGHLGIHVDFNQLGQRLFRRINCFIYLNEDWQDDWGGHLELWRDMRTCEVKIAPLFNRFVAFESSSRSWHGHPHPLGCPENRCRLSFAAYYYTTTMPPWFREKQSTVYVSGRRKKSA